MALLIALYTVTYIAENISQILDAVRALLTCAIVKSGWRRLEASFLGLAGLTDRGVCST